MSRPAVLASAAALLGRRGPVLAGALAALAAVPGLRLPFLADDWADLAMVAQGPPARTPFGYFRPLCMATYWIERQACGLSPAAGHLVNLALASAAAALVVVLLRRYTGDAFLAAATGLLFALHPYHVENTAWIAARADLLFSLLFILAALAYDRWRRSPRGAPIAALALFEAALLAKEAALTLPAFLLVLGLCDRERRPGAVECARGYLPLAGLAAAHFLLLRPWALQGTGMTLAGYAPVTWLKNLLAFGVAAVLPAHIESIEGRPLAWGALALLATGGLLGAARARAGRVPPAVLAAVPIFAVLVGPHVISFQERYLFLPGAASALAIAALLRAAGRRTGGLAGALLVAGWCLSLAAHWTGWSAAGRASRQLVGGLVEASRRPEVREIVVANMPHRVHGAPVAADFAAAMALSGGRRVAVRAAASVDYLSPRADGLDGPAAIAIEKSPPIAEVRLRVRDGIYSRIVRPVRPPGGGPVETPWATVRFEGPGELRVRIPLADGRAAFVWRGGGLERLDQDPSLAAETSQGPL